MTGQRLRRNDDGFTLIELVVAVAILGIIAFALTGIVMEYLKVTTSTEARLNESTDMQFVSTYWQRDVSSMGVRTFDAVAVDPVPAQQSLWVGVADPGGCGVSVTGSQPIVSFAWNGYTSGASDPTTAWNATTDRAAYVAVADGSQFTVKRVWCGAGSIPTIVVARHVTTWHVLCDATTCGTGLPNVVQLNLHVQDKTNAGTPNTGYDVTLTAERRQG